MGSFAKYHGNSKIPEDKQELFAEQMRRILDLGGMMNTTEVRMFDQTLTLLQPVGTIKEDKIYFHYNYFEDRGWETACFIPKETDLWSEKIGDYEFSDTMTAAYMLYELYDPDYGFAKKDGDFVDASKTIGWLNQILRTQFSMGKRADLWTCMEWNAFSVERDKTEMYMLRSLIPHDRRNAVGGTDLTDLLCIIHGTENLIKEGTHSGSYVSDILQCKQELLRFLEANPDVEVLWNLLKKSYKEREQEKREELLPLAKLTLIMPARVFVYLTAEIREEKFWALWKNLYTNVYHDEQIKAYASAELIKWRREKLREPFEPIRTSDFLRQDGYFAFYDTPEELKGKPNFYISDADRLYWWDGSNEVEITVETDAWLKELAAQHKKITESKELEGNSISRLQSFMKMLAEINLYYWHILPFESMFYDFVEHISQTEYCAAIELIRQVADAEENRKAGKISNYGGIGNTKSKNVTGNSGRIRVKRLYAALANKQLRQKYFAF